MLKEKMGVKFDTKTRRYKQVSYGGLLIVLLVLLIILVVTMYIGVFRWYPSYLKAKPVCDVILYYDNGQEGTVIRTQGHYCELLVERCDKVKNCKIIDENPYMILINRIKDSSNITAGVCK